MNGRDGRLITVMAMIPAPLAVVLAAVWLVFVLAVVLFLSLALGLVGA